MKRKVDYMKSKDERIRELKNDLQIETGISPAYLDDIMAWILNNISVANREEIPHIFGDHTPAQRIFSEIVGDLLNL
jgi:hypothetical protein